MRTVDSTTIAANISKGYCNFTDIYIEQHFLLMPIAALYKYFIMR